MDNHTIIHLLHILLNGPFLIYLGLSRSDIIYLYYLLLMMGCLLFGLSIYKILNNSAYTWLYIHLIIFAPLFIGVSYMKLSDKIIPDYLYTSLYAIGFASIAHHALRLIK
jgi:hypothetical protein